MTEAKSNPVANGHDGQPQGPQFAIQSIYVKDISFESPKAPHIFREEWKPAIDFDLQMGSQLISEADHVFEVTLHITVTVKLGEDKVAFLAEVQQAGIFTLKGFDANLLKEVLAITCPTVLFPYARETVTQLIQKGGFPQFILPPINFEAMYAQHLAKEKEKGKATEAVS